MFSRWRMTLMMANTPNKITTEISSFNKRRINGDAIKAINDPTDTFRVRATKTAQTPIVASAPIHETTNNTPSVVATPLPPRNFKKTLQLWPSTAKPESHRGAPNPRVANPAATPFPMSKTNAKTPQGSPADRATLVAPGLPEPTFWMSMPRAFAIHKLNGNVPST